MWWVRIGDCGNTYPCIAISARTLAISHILHRQHLTNKFATLHTDGFIMPAEPWLSTLPIPRDVPDSRTGTVPHHSFSTSLFIIVPHKRPLEAIFLKQPPLNFTTCVFICLNIYMQKIQLFFHLTFAPVRATLSPRRMHVLENRTHPTQHSRSWRPAVHAMVGVGTAGGGRHSNTQK